MRESALLQLQREIRAFSPNLQIDLFHSYFSAYHEDYLSIQIAFAKNNRVCSDILGAIYMTGTPIIKTVVLSNSTVQALLGSMTKISSLESFTQMTWENVALKLSMIPIKTSTLPLYRKMKIGITILRVLIMKKPTLLGLFLAVQKMISMRYCLF